MRQQALVGVTFYSSNVVDHEDGLLCIRDVGRFQRCRTLHQQLLHRVELPGRTHHHSSSSPPNCRHRILRVHDLCRVVSRRANLRLYKGAASTAATAAAATTTLHIPVHVEKLGRHHSGTRRARTGLDTHRWEVKQRIATIVKWEIQETGAACADVAVMICDHGGGSVSMVILGEQAVRAP